MLVLTRKKGERVVIGDGIVVTVIDIRGDGVRIGFDAPRGIPIQRAEVIAAVTEANAAAADAAEGTEALLVGLLGGPRAAVPEAEPRVLQADAAAAVQPDAASAQSDSVDTAPPVPQPTAQAAPARPVPTPPTPRATAR